MSYVNNRRFRGNPRAVVSAIGGAVVMSRTSGQTPCFVHVSASGITATGTDVPYEDLEIRVDFGDPTGTELFTDPNTGQIYNANIQYGADLPYCYRSAGVYTVTMRVRGLTSGGEFLTEVFTSEVTVTAFDTSAGEMWFDSVAGSDANDGLSIEAPKQTITAVRAAVVSNRAMNIKRGSHYTGTQGISLTANTVAGLRIRPYGSGAAPIIEITSGTAEAFFGSNGTAGNQRPKTDIVISGLDLRQSVGGSALQISATSNAVAVIEDVYIDNCSMYSAADTGVTTCVMQFSDAKTRRQGLWNCSISAPLASGTGLKHGVYGGAYEWFFCIGGSIEGGGTSATLDHHMYIQTHNHSSYKWINFGQGNGRNYCINANLSQEGAELEYGQYHYLGDNHFTGTKRGFDASETSLTIDEIRFKNFVSDGNFFVDLTGDGGIFFYSAETMTVRGSKVWGCDDGRWFAPVEDAGLLGLAISTILKAKVYDNDIHFSATSTFQAITFSRAFTEAQQITDNRIVDLRAAAEAIRVNFAGATAAGDLIDYNQVYAPNDTTMMFDGATAKTWAEWQAAGFDAGGSNTDPAWIDPAAGVFDLPAGRMRMGLRAG